MKTIKSYNNSNTNVNTVNGVAAPMGGADNAGTQPGNGSKPDKEDPKPRKAAQKSPADLVLAQYRKVYARQIDPTSDINKKILAQAVATGVSSGFPEEKFLREMSRRIDILLSFSYFMEECSDCGLEPFTAASHYVLSGWQALADYLMRRKNTKLQPTRLWGEGPMFEESEMVSLEAHIRKVLPEKPSQTDAGTANA